MPGQYLIQVISKCFSIALVQRRWATGIDAAGTKRLHKISHVQPGFYIIDGIQFTARAERGTAFLDDVCCQRYVAGYNEIALVHAFHYLVVRDIEPLSYLQELNIV